MATATTDLARVAGALRVTVTFAGFAVGAVRVAAEASNAILYTVVLVPLAVRVAFLGRLTIAIVVASRIFIVTWYLIAAMVRQ